MNVAAVHMKAVLGDVKYNLQYAKNKIIEAKSNGAEMIIFPEFFTTGFTFSEKIITAIATMENPFEVMKAWAKDFDIIIGGSSLFFNGKDVHNTFALVFPSGEGYYHSKDIATALENYCYVDGDENNVFETPIGNIGVVMCWEQLRYDTLRRMVNRNVNLIVGGSCWWSIVDSDIQGDNILKEYSKKLAQVAPINISKIMKVPIVHASFNNKFMGRSFPDGSKEEEREILSPSIITNGKGEILEKVDYYQEEKLLIDDIDISKTSKTVIDSNKYWIADFPEEFTKMFFYINEKCRKFYDNVTIKKLVK